jgi:two-component system sensor histidine kinase ArlS
MKIRNKILLYFSVTSILLVGILFSVVFWIFSEYREEDFQQRQKEKIITTLHFISEIQKDEHELTKAVDRLSINSMLNEKLLIFDSTKSLIYSNLDDVPISYSNKLLSELNEDNIWIEQKDGLYDVVAIHFKENNTSYYGISKAFDTFGYNKSSALKRILIAAFCTFTVLVILISVYIANRISKPISALATLLGKYRVGEKPHSNNLVTNTFEIDYLNEKFNDLVSRTNNAYAFQKNAVHHISHQLKTPIAVLISELERMKKNTENVNLQNDFDRQISKTKSLAEIINTLLEISKIESGQSFNNSNVRIDELIFDCISELNTLYPEFIFEVNYLPAEPDAELLVVKGNEMLIRQAFENLLNNCITYSNNPKAEIKIDISEKGILRISVVNFGTPVSEEERNYLFTHFFRGENSRNKIGFGLGLALTKNIIELHNGSIKYSNPAEKVNVFEIVFPAL